MASSLDPKCQVHWLSQRLLRSPREIRQGLPADGFPRLRNTLAGQRLDQSMIPRGKIGLTAAARKAGGQVVARGHVDTQAIVAALDSAESGR